MILGVFESAAQFLEVMGVWLAATATFAAAFVALKIANYTNDQHVKVVARPMVEVNRGSPEPLTKIFCVSAINVGQRPVTIMSIVIKSRFPKYNAVLLEGLAGSSQIPLTLNDGEVGQWRYPEIGVDGKNWYRGLAEHFSSHGYTAQWLLIHNLRFSVVTTLGHEFTAVRSRDLRKKIREQITEIRLEK